MTRFGLAALFVLVFAGCLGSASETPWPPEPADVDLGPAGELELSKVPRARANPSSSAVAPAATTSPSARPSTTTTVNPAAF
jgi:hypothetical protein